MCVIMPVCVLFAVCVCVLGVVCVSLAAAVLAFCVFTFVTIFVAVISQLYFVVACMFAVLFCLCVFCVDVLWIVYTFQWLSMCWLAFFLVM